MNYIWGMDLSLSCTGISIFEENGNPIKTLSIPTSIKNGEHGRRLKIIADILLELRKQYPPNLIVLESGFSRHAVSTQVLFKLRGLVDYLFYDIKEVVYAPSSIKKIITGNGRSDKSLVQQCILKKFPNMIFENEDESDATGAILCWFIENNLIKL
jgi:Holliday junction resolvasome RuvABC endonuclease subunit